MRDQNENANFTKYEGSEKQNKTMNCPAHYEIKQYRWITNIKHLNSKSQRRTRTSRHTSTTLTPEAY